MKTTNNKGLWSFFSRSASWKVCNLERLYHHMGQGIQAWTSKMCGRQPLKKLKWYGLDRPYYFKFLRLSSTNYIWFILEYLVPYLVFHPNLMSWSCFPLDTLKMTIDFFTKFCCLIRFLELWILCEISTKALNTNRIFHHRQYCRKSEAAISL